MVYALTMNALKDESGLWNGPNLTVQKGRNNRINLLKEQRLFISECCMFRKPQTDLLKLTQNFGLLPQFHITELGKLGGITWEKLSKWHAHLYPGILGISPDGQIEWKEKKQVNVVGWGWELSDPFILTCTGKEKKVNWTLFTMHKKINSNYIYKKDTLLQNTQETAYQTGIGVTKSVVQCKSLKHLKQGGVVKVARVWGDKFVHAMFLGSVSICLFPCVEKNKV